MVNEDDYIAYYIVTAASAACIMQYIIPISLFVVQGFRRGHHSMEIQEANGKPLRIQVSRF